jgi:hypothetical protein|tara:strand:- start:1500 stop:1793 length:294 start_codon:yes stop_codon:yes gene_type:complete
MASLINLNINVENLPKEKFVKGKKGVYYNFTISVNDETNQFGQNVSAFDSQTKEEREAKKPKQYIGNGKVVWTDGKSTKAQQEAQPQDNDNNVDLPF